MKAIAALALLTGLTSGCAESDSGYIDFVTASAEPMKPAPPVPPPPKPGPDICTSDLDCTGPGKARCQLPAGRCVACLVDVDCMGPKIGVCEPTRGECVGCVSNADCDAGRACVPNSTCMK